MKGLNRLLIADTLRIWRQGLAICLLMACGIATFVMSTSSMRSVDISRQRYYQQYHFADVFVQLVRAPKHLVRRLAEIPGVERAEARIVRDVLLDIPEMIEPASCRLVSISGDQATSLNGVYLRQGRFPNEYGRIEVVVSEIFAEAHGLLPGDSLMAVIGGRKQRLHIVGLGMSPEYVYAVQPGLLVTDNRRFGVIWLPERQIATAFNMEGAFNDASLKLQPRASVDGVIAQVDLLTKAYGGIGAYGRDDQESHSRVSDEMHQMRTMALVTPSIFLSVVAFLFNIVFSRLVHQQKEQIATLRAFGYRSWEIGLYYAKLVLILVIVGAILGWLGGMRLSWWLTGQYARFFRFPQIYHEFSASDALAAGAIGLCASLLGAYSAIRNATRLPPAVAMQPETPPPYRGLFTSSRGIVRWLSPTGRMVVRRLEANRWATSLSVLGIAMGLAVVILGAFVEDAIDYVIDYQFEAVQRQDVTLTFHETLSPRALHDVVHLPGVRRVEPFRSVPVRLKCGPRHERLSLMGLDESPELFRVLDDRQQPVQLPANAGLTITQKLAEMLDVGRGEEVIVEVLDGSTRQRSLRVSQVFPNFTAPAAYINRNQLHAFLREGERLSGAFVEVDSQELTKLYGQVKQLPTIVGVQDKTAAMDTFRSTVSESTSLMRTVNALFASAIALGVIYNCALITLTERARDLATLRVMGFTRSEVSTILLAELAIITLLAIPLGLPLGYGFAYVTTLALDTETHRFPLVIQRDTYAYATVVILLAATFSALYVRRMLDNIDMLSVLKATE